MLALGSLQMARLQGAPHTASMKHYHLSLRRIARNCGSPSRRVQPATLAATMLLGFYEVWNSDHDKWCKHLWGARAILREIPIRDMTKKIIALKREQRQYLQNFRTETGDEEYANSIVAERDIDQVDSALVAQLSGRPVAYDDSATSGSTSSTAPHSWTAPHHYTEKDIETYELIADVFWWYCKMDVYQSILGGTPLLYVSNLVLTFEQFHFTNGYLTGWITRAGHSALRVPQLAKSMPCKSYLLNGRQMRFSQSANQTAMAHTITSCSSSADYVASLPKTRPGNAK